jgi:HemY protein
MKLLITIIVALALALWLGLGLHHSPGKMIVSVAGWRVDAPLWLGVVALIVSYFLLHLMVRLTMNIINTPAFVRKFSNSLKQKRAKRFTKKGLLALAEGQNRQAEKMLVRGALHSDNAWWNYLCAAKAAQALGEDERRDIYLRRAFQDTPETNSAVRFTQAKLQYENGQYSESVRTLEELLQKAPHHDSALKLLQLNYVQLKSWEKLLQLLPRLKQVLGAQEMKEVEKTVYANVLKEMEKTGSFADMETFWRSIPKPIRLEGDVAIVYAKVLHKAIKPVEAENIIKQSLSHEWREDLVSLYGQITHPLPQKMLANAELWLNLHPDSAGLLLALGRLCEQQQLWGKAQRYFEASLSLSPRPETYAELGALLERMNKPELGAQYFKKGLLLSHPVMAKDPLLAPSQ